MACKSCGPKASPPIFRASLPTVWAWGPFPGHEVVPPSEVDAYLAELKS